MKQGKGVDKVAHIVIVPATEGSIEEQVHLHYDGDVSLNIDESGEAVLVTVVDEDGTDIVFEDPASYSFEEDE